MESLMLGLIVMAVFAGAIVLAGMAKAKQNHAAHKQHDGLWMF